MQLFRARKTTPFDSVRIHCSSQSFKVFEFADDYEVLIRLRIDRSDSGDRSSVCWEHCLEFAWKEKWLMGVGSDRRTGIEHNFARGTCGQKEFTLAVCERSIKWIFIADACVH